MTPHVADLVIAKFQTTGNISETFWKTSTDNVQRKYDYKYDDLNRLLQADYSKQGNTEFNSYLEHLTYDKNGNIQTLLRNGNMDTDGMQFANPIDELTYVYDNNNKNRLLSVSDATTNPQGFKDGINSGDDYTYDANGNMTRDDNKGITNITYNHLNLPVIIYFADDNKIAYLYNATGQKVSKIVTQTDVTTTTDYLSGFQYKRKTASEPVELQFFPHAEGYVNATQNGTSYTFNYVYNYTDHLGNIRLSYSQDPSTNVLKVIEENHYYPFGLKHTGYNSDQMMYVKEENFIKIKSKPALFKTSYNYKYNGKELQEELGLNMYDYGARNYDAALGRWMNVDPLAEKMRRHSPYNYAFNNPMRFTDPDGMKPVDWIKWTNHEGQKFITYDSGVKTINQAKEKGYSNIEKVFEKGSGHSTSTNETFTFEKGGLFSVNDALLKNVKNEVFTAENGVTINGNKSYTQQFASIFSGIGDYSAYGAAASTSTGIGAPIGAVLGVVSAITGGVGAGFEVIDGIFNSETISINNPEQLITKTATNIVAPMLLNKVGLNNVEKPLIDMLIMSADKTIDHGRDNLVGPYYPENDK